MAADGKYRNRQALCRAVNEALGLDWSDAKWRALFNRNADAKERIERALGKVKLPHVRAQAQAASEIVIHGSVRGATLSDEHSPFFDPRAIDAAVKVLEKWQPDVLVFAGDQLDCYHLSKFDTNPARLFNLQDEIDLWRRGVLRPVRRAVGPKCRIIKIDGNHEKRLTKYLWTHPELFGLRALQMASLLELEKENVEYTPERVRFGNVLEVSHGKFVRKWAGASAAAELLERRYSRSTITGHVHRAGRFVTKDGRGGTVTGQENPCLCSLSPEYMVDPDWQQGLTLFEVKKGRPVWIQAVGIDNGVAAGWNYA